MNFVTSEVGCHRGVSRRVAGSPAAQDQSFSPQLRNGNLTHKLERVAQVPGARGEQQLCRECYGDRGAEANCVRNSARIGQCRRWRS